MLIISIIIYQSLLNGTVISLQSNSNSLCYETPYILICIIRAVLALKRAKMGDPILKACKFNGVVSGPHFSMTILIQIVEKNVAIIIFLA